MALRYTVDFARFVCGTDTIYLNYIIFPRLRQSLKLIFRSGVLIRPAVSTPKCPVQGCKKCLGGTVRSDAPCLSSIADAGRAYNFPPLHRSAAS